jgi:hypothetical protein
LYLPEDLQLWEMVGIIELVDKEIFKDKSEKAARNKERLLKLGKIFMNAGIYIARRLDAIEEGKEIAEALALQLYQYGQSLVYGKETTEPKIEEIKTRKLTPEETAEVG